MTRAKQSPLARAANLILPRLRLENRLVTGSIILSIFAWYLFQLVVFFQGSDEEFVLWMFTTESFPAFSPGIFFAIISHAFPPNFTHLSGNIVFLWLFGGESEQHMGQLETGAFFVTTALASVLTGTALSGDNTMGASGGALAFIGFYCVHMTLDHREKLDFDTLRSNGLSSLRVYWGVALFIAPVVIVLFLIAQAIGIVPVGRADVVGHLTGVLLGIGYAVARYARTLSQGDRQSSQKRAKDYFL